MKHSIINLCSCRKRQNVSDDATDHQSEDKKAKKKKKRKTNEENETKNETDSLAESGARKGSRSWTISDGLIAEELKAGEEDGKVATSGKKACLICFGAYYQ